MKTSHLALVALVALLGCDDRVPITDVPVDPGDPRPIDLGTGPARPRRRMDIDQLDQTLRSVTGGIGWVDSSGRDLFVTNRETLGVPDWVSFTNEDLEASALFVKFLDDAARSACTTLIDRDADAAAADRVFFVHAEPTAMLPADQAAIDENLSYLLLRYHGRRVAVGSEEMLPWRGLYRDARAATDDPNIAWRTVCVALVDHPDFYTY
jgi:hypothetical protein